MNTEKPFFDPKTDGPGIWKLLHIQSVNAKTYKEKLTFYDQMTFLSLHFPCKKCRKHISQYIGDNPPELYMDITIGDKDVSCFKWLHGLHNTANLRLGKPILSFEAAYALYDPDIIKPCNSGCDSDSDDEKEQKVVSPKVIVQKTPLVKIGNNKPIKIIGTKK